MRRKPAPPDHRTGAGPGPAARDSSPETGHAADALEQARAGLALDSDNPRTLGEAGFVLAVTGHSDRARELLARLKKLFLHGAANPVFSAFIYSELGQKSEALDALEHATDSKSCCGLAGLPLWHTTDTLQDDPRYQGLLAKVQEMRTPHPVSNGSPR
jgi:hypothetical protein